jgi:hypothetical protein
MDKKFLSIVAIISFSILFIGIFLVVKNSPPSLADNVNASLELLEPSNYDWGTIDIFGGNVEKTFNVKNIGTDDLEISQIKTSCTCTEAQLITGEETGPLFGMHTISAWKGVIKPQEEAQIRVVFDPLFHGPEGVGPVVRLVGFSTNDPDNRQIELAVTANVVKN